MDNALDDRNPAPKGRRHRRRMQGVTMTDVAARADVSPSTVSLYIRKPEAVMPETGQAIERAIKALNYVPNMVAGGLAAATSRIVSVIVPSVRNAFFAETVAALQNELGRAGIQVLLGHAEYNPDTEEDLVRAALSWSPAAIVLTGLSHSSATRQLLLARSTPVVEVWELGSKPPIDMAVGFHHDEVGALAARHLLQRGRRRLAFLGARMQEDWRAAQRAEGFLSAAENEGSDRAGILNHPSTASAQVGAMLLAQALDRWPDADGIACSNDHVALGVLFECQRRKIAVPGELAVVGFGDLSFASASCPTLTTIRPAGDLIGTEAARLILERIRGDIAAMGQSIDTRFAILERQST